MTLHLWMLIPAALFLWGCGFLWHGTRPRIGMVAFTMQIAAVVVMWAMALLCVLVRILP